METEKDSNNAEKDKVLKKIREDSFRPNLMHNVD